MAIHWQVKFRSLRSNILFTANIYDDGYTGATPVQLTGAAVPFETQEDDSDDPFEPVRTQSGYLRFVDTREDNDGNAFDWRTFIPTTDTDRPVTLTNEDGTVLWMGFMQAQNFGALLYDSPQEREFPLQCPLTVTSRADINYTQTQIQNFAYLLLQVVDGIPSPCRPTSFVVQGGAKAREWLTKRIDWQNFATTDDDGNLVPKYDLLQCLTEMCRFWGWTARINRQVLYLVSADDTSLADFLTLRREDLAGLSYGMSDVGSISTGFTPAGFGDDIFASVNNDDFQMRGPNKVVVTADGNCGHSTLIETYPQEVTKELFEGAHYTEDYGDIRCIYTDDKNDFSSPFMNGQCIPGSGSFNILRVTGNDLSSHLEGTDYNVIRIRPSYSGSEYVRLETVFSHSFFDDYSIGGFSSGGIKISFDVLRKGEKYEHYNSQGIGLSHIKLRLGVGETRNAALWRFGNTWSTTQSEISLRCGDREDLGNNVIYTAGTNMSGLHGKIFLDILGSDDMEPVGTSYPDAFEIANLKVEFIRSYHVGISSVFDRFERVTQRKYTAGDDNFTREETEEDVIFASDNEYEFGLGIILNTDDTQFSGTDYDGSGTLVHPEQHLADRIIDYWQVSRRKLDCELRSDKIMELTPRVVGTIDGTRVYPVSVSHNWRDEVERVIFIELPEQ